MKRTNSTLTQTTPCRRLRRTLALTVALTSSMLVLPVLPVSPLQAEILVVRGATVHPVSAEPFVGSIVIEDGTIIAVGADAAAPSAATVIEAEGLHVYPGMMDALSQVGLVEVNAVAATDDQAEMGTYNPHLAATTAIHPASEVIPVTRANGVTHVLAAPQTDSGGVIPGRAAVIHLDGWTVEEMLEESSQTLVITWPGVVTRSFDFSTFSFKESPFKEAEETAQKAQNELRDWFDAARHYAQATAGGTVRAARNLKLEALGQALAGDRPIVVIADAKRDLEDAIAFAEEQEIDLVLAGGRDAWQIKETLAEKSIPVILGMTQSLPQDDDDPYDRPYGNPGELVAAGVKIAFGSGAGGGFGPGGPHNSRLIAWESATAIPYGLAAEDALRAVTLWPAEILGVAERLGSIEPGKRANLIVTDRSPLELTFELRHLIIGGVEVSTGNRHLALYEKYRGR